MLILLSVITALLGVATISIILLRTRKESMKNNEQELLRVQFAELAADKLSEKLMLLSEQNQKDVSVITKGIRDELLLSMKELQTATTSAIHSNRIISATLEAQIKGVRDSIEGQIRGVRESAELLGRKAEGLEHALAGGGKSQGIWGEAVLDHVLESSGLRKDVDYFLQQGAAGVGIPDAQVIDPAGRILVIDSKTSLTAFLASVNATDEETKNRYLNEHVKSVRSHIHDLASKTYIEKLKKQSDKTYVSQVAMFVPSEAAHAAALSHDPTITQYAYENGVAITTPLTLLPYLRIVSLAWQQDSIEKNLQAVFDKARIILERIDGSMKYIEDMGDALKKSNEAYEHLSVLLGSREGKFNLITPAEDLISIGAKMNRAKSKALSDATHRKVES